MFCCGKKRPNHLRVSGKPYDIYLLSQKFRFAPDELRTHERRFLHMADGDGFTFQSFCKNMGLLGLPSTQVIAQRIFRVMDKSRTGKVSFELFLEYMDVLMHGSKDEKAWQSFKLIASPHSHTITYEDFVTWIVSSWKMYNAVTGREVSASHEEIRHLFNSLDLKEDGLVDFEEYRESMRNNSPFFELFSIVDKRIAEDFSELTDPVMTKLATAQQQLSACIQYINQQHIASNSPRAPSLIRQPQLGPQCDPSDGSAIEPVGDLDSVLSLASISLDDIPDVEDSQAELEILLSSRSLASDSTEVFQGTNSQILSLLQDLNQKLEEIRSGYQEQVHARPVAPPKQATPKNSVIQWGDEDWNLILNMMLGIQRASRAVPDIDGELNPNEFSQVVKHELLPENSSKCMFSDHAPLVFKRIRRQYDISEDSYINSLGIEKIMHSLWQGEFSSLVGQLSSGKSGSFFYFSDDGRFVIKTISHKEFLFLKKILPSYYQYLREHPDTLIPRFYGCHMIVAHKGKRLIKEYFIVMSNVFDKGYDVHMTYDLKGSTYKRRTPADADFSVPRKDIDFIRASIKISLPPEKADRLKTILTEDAHFLQSMNIMDYSVLLGIHYLRGQRVQPQPGSFAEQDGGGLLSADGAYVYFIGVIDILTPYTGKKRFENFIKGKFQGTGISCVPPEEYAERFRNFMHYAIE